VENDGAHATKTVTGPVQTLSSGPQTINAKYFEDVGGQNLTVRYKGPDTGDAWVVIPNSALRSGNPSTMMMATSEGEPEVLETNPAMNVNVFPNPLTAAEDINVQVDSKNSDQPVHVSLVGMMGQPYYEHTFGAGELTSGALVRPNEKLYKGIYIMVIKQGDTTIRQRVVIKD
jgi:hypothetical protein